MAINDSDFIRRGSESKQEDSPSGKVKFQFVQVKKGNNMFPVKRGIGFLPIVVPSPPRNARTINAAIAPKILPK